MNLIDKNSTEKLGFKIINMTAKELRQKFLDFFEGKGHAIIPSSSLIPEHDPTALFTSAGMHPLVPYLLGQPHPAGRRLADVQKCVRTTDIEEVGDTYHHTFFEMLGNWSLDDYFKTEAINWSWEFLTGPDWLNLDRQRLAVSVFLGDQDAPFDQESYDIWRELGLPAARIAKLPKADNWWGPAGQSGPCGPDTEMFYWAESKTKAPAKFNPANKRWVEIWNDVFMQYNKNAAGDFKPLKQQNVDTGMGLERTLAVINGLVDNYQTELFSNIINKIERLSGQSYGQSDQTNKAMRVIADHLKAATFIMADPARIRPANLDQGYIVRRLIRRAIRYGRLIGIKQPVWTKEIAKIVAHDYLDTYQELETSIDFVVEQLEQEETKFKKTLERGLNEFKKISSPTISARDSFNLYQTYGFPIEMTKELAAEQGKQVDEAGFNQELAKHQELSRTAAVGKFKGGLADASAATIKLHTAAHLLLAALRQALGQHVEQRGSNITAERLRFDFSHPDKLTEEEKNRIEQLVNQAIKSDLKVSAEEMSLIQAKRQGAVGVFEAKYGDRVKVYTVADGRQIFSREICGGPHVEHTGQLNHFKITKEESSGAGIRRIKAVLE